MSYLSDSDDGLDEDILSKDLSISHSDTESDNESAPPPKSRRLDDQTFAHSMLQLMFAAFAKEDARSSSMSTAGTLPSAGITSHQDHQGNTQKVNRFNELHDKMDGLFTQFEKEKMEFKNVTVSSGSLRSKYKQMDNASDAWKGVPIEKPITALSTLNTTVINNESSDEDEPLATRLQARLAKPRIPLIREESKKRKAIELQQPKTTPYTDFTLDSKDDDNYAYPLRCIQNMMAHNPVDSIGIIRNLIKAVERNVAPKDVFKTRKKAPIRGAAPSKNRCLSSRPQSTSGDNVEDEDDEKRLERVWSFCTGLDNEHAFAKSVSLCDSLIAHRAMVQQKKFDMINAQKQKHDGGDKLLQAEQIGKMAWSLSQETFIGIPALIMMGETPHKIHRIRDANLRLGFHKALDRSRPKKDGVVDRGLPKHFSAAVDSFQYGVLPMLEFTLVHHLRHRYEELDPAFQRYFAPLTEEDDDNFKITIYDRHTDRFICKTKMMDIHTICGVDVPKKKSADKMIKLHKTMNTKAYPDPLKLEVATALTYSNAHHLQQLTMTDEEAMMMYEQDGEDWLSMLHKPELMKEAGVEGKLNPCFAFWAGCARHDKIEEAIANCFTPDAFKDDTLDKERHWSFKITPITARDIRKERLCDEQAKKGY